MTNTTTRLRTLFGGGTDTDQMADALAWRLDDEEQVAYRLTSTDGLECERQGQTHRKGTDGDGTVLAATDRKLVFVVDTGDSVETADIAYTDLKRVERKGGLLSSTLQFSVWGRGKFRCTPTGGDDSSVLVEFVERASETAQRTVAALQDARQHTSQLLEQMADGDETAAFEARDAARSHLRRARSRLDPSPDSVREHLAERVEDAETELERTRLRARLERGKALAEEADHAADQADYDREYERAHATLRRAREHLAVARSIAEECGFGLAGAVRAELATLEDRVVTLESQPLELAEAARERAQAATTPERAVVAWETTLEHYRDALTAGWGTPADFDGDTDALRLQIEWVVANVVHHRRQIADALEAEGHELRADGDTAGALDRYEAARDQLAMAQRLAEQYRAGDTATLERERERLRTKCIAAV